ncbi:low molecular weight protein-tyrosine-phosphatase [Aurantibacter sp.]|uniref:low molecular weight protein-tyrosine-phosphatase n=1 Tax=Aurantibacter sp. TaxID=2807103 RepID=UPI003263AA0E
MVCLGNICRSPLAEGILKSKVNSANVYVDSAGTGGYHIGSKPDSRSIEIAHKFGIDITNQRCRKFHISDFERFDVIYVMDDSNYENILDLANSASDEQKVKLLLDVLDYGPQEVPDPYYGGKDGFKNVYHMIDEACSKIANSLNQLN